MYIQELYALSLWVQEEVVTKQILQKYQQLVQKLTENSQPNRQKQPFDIQKNTLIKALEEMNIATLNEEQQLFLNKLNIFNILGTIAIEELENILYKNALDIATATQEINRKYTLLNQGIAKINQIREGLTGLVEVEEHIIDKAIIRVHFDNEAAIDNITDFKKWSVTWYDIGRGITMVHRASPEDISVIGANKGSIVIELATAYAITKTLSDIILKVLKVVEKVYDIRKKAEEIRSMKLSNDKISNELEKEANNIKKTDIEAIVDSISETESLSDGEVKTNLSKAITKLLDFVDKGGEIDFTLPDDADDEEPEDKEKGNLKQLLKTKFQEIRLLEDKLKQVEHIKQDS